jgi:hypothetical protein
MIRHLARLAAGVLTGALLVPAAPASAAVADACVGSSGVTVVVDFSAFGQGIRVVCVASVPSTGIGALRAAGFSTVGTTHDGPGYVCRINGLPTADTEACVVTPPTTAYWSYWHAARGGSWVYSTAGAAFYHPEPGSVEGWAFGSGGPPGIAPPAPIAEPAPPPPPPAPQPTTVRPPAGGGGAGSTEAESSPPPESPSDSPSASTSLSATATPSSTVDFIADPPPPPGDEDSGALGTVIGLVLVAGLAAAAITIALRRRAALARDPSSTESVNKGPFLSSGDPEG